MVIDIFTKRVYFFDFLFAFLYTNPLFWQVLSTLIGKNSSRVNFRLWVDLFDERNKNIVDSVSQSSCKCICPSLVAMEKYIKFWWYCLRGGILTFIMCHIYLYAESTSSKCFKGHLKLTCLYFYFALLLHHRIIKISTIFNFFF